MLARLAAPLFLALLVSAKLTITTPEIKECEPATFQVDGGTGTILLDVLPSEKPCEHDPIQHVDTGLNGGGQYILHHTLKAGTSVVVIVDDAQGDEGWSNTIVVAACPSSSSTSSTSRTSGTASVAGTSSTRRPTASVVPVNAGDDSTNGAIPAKASFGAGVVALVSAFAFLA
ncbi:SubName: Full=Uncharacterized protein {ECO:0000313/EMBL:CCA68989.1} [Serendipita indica DSM 11827]|uniref:GPI anchored protein n=1 Tax=Serendipita indica (strain DSM 11827) TaxID=1109443 RepID=G4TCG4_SERID|nr:SubName: Full=Uncharacterized protein {ECO:0000313/EMBL:CCA68989.1} [Serendipita indica DSM 11827]CCA68989.1 hypothetical protein PIIN_02849 [Serendipita indica DSM 11827]